MGIANTPRLIAVCGVLLCGPLCQGETSQRATATTKTTKENPVEGRDTSSEEHAAGAKTDGFPTVEERTERYRAERDRLDDERRECSGAARRRFLHGAILGTCISGNPIFAAPIALWAERKGRPKPPPTEQVLALFQEAVAGRWIFRLDVYYTNWGTFMLPSSLGGLERDEWTCKTSIKYPDLGGLATTLAGVTLEPLGEPARDFRLSFIVTDYEEKNPLELSFGRLPLCVCIDGTCFKPSWELLLTAAEYLPQHVRDELIRNFREDWEFQGYPPLPEDGDER